jgi:hypothetical protein
MPARDAYGTRSSVWTAALLVALLLHAATLLGLRRWDPAGTAARAQAAAPAPLQFVFAPAPTPATPSTFTELPPDRADEAPERADFLSNIDSRARDTAPGGEDAVLPASTGRADFPQVAMAAGETAAQQPQPRGEEAPASEPEVPPEEPPLERATARDATLEPRRTLPRQGLPRGEDPLAPYRRFDPASLVAPSPQAGAPGDADITQEAMESADGNVRLLGDVSLNTTAWVYGYWMQRFRRAVESHWHAPYAFQIGMIKGWTLVGLEVSRTGALLQLEVLAEEGHWTLRDASVAAIQAAAPFEPLPADAPEQSLRLQIRMIYTDYGR